MGDRRPEGGMFFVASGSATADKDGLNTARWRPEERCRAQASPSLIPASKYHGTELLPDVDTASVIRL